MNKHYFNFLKAVAEYYNVPLDSLLRGQSFSLEVPTAALLGENIQQRSDFLKEINMVQVMDVKGHKLFGATEKPITGRKKDGRYLASLEHSQATYELAETDSGVIVPWMMFDQFARLNNGGELSALYSEYVQTQIALDILQVGWHGSSVAEDTVADDLSDVNVGWLHQLKRDREANVLTGSTIYGKGDDWATLDDLALELKQALDYRHQNRTDLVFLVGADLANAEARYITQHAKLTPTERVALGSHNLMGSFGGMVAMTPPNFPANGAAVTTLKNLSVYTQGSSVRRRFESDEDRKGVIDSYYRMEGYVVEDLGLMTMAENITINKPEEKAQATAPQE